MRHHARRHGKSKYGISRAPRVLLDLIVIRFLDRALELGSNSSVVRGLRGLYFQRIGNHRQALIEFQSAAKLEPENPTWYASIGDEFANLGDLILALQAYQYATTLVPEDATYWRLLAGFCVFC